MWFPYEPIGEYISSARQVRAAFEAAACLRRSEYVPVEHWLTLGCKESNSRRELRWQRFFLAKWIEGRFMLRGGSNLRVDWTDESQASLSIESGWGFIGAVWLGVAQIITEARSLNVCDGCSVPYIRQKRRSRKGERNYCDTCGSRASKRDWARRKGDGY